MSRAIFANGFSRAAIVAMRILDHRVLPVIVEKPAGRHDHLLVTVQRLVARAHVEDVRVFVVGFGDDGKLGAQAFDAVVELNQSFLQVVRVHKSALCVLRGTPC
jgi:hypothetical protein